MQAFRACKLALGSPLRPLPKSIPDQVFTIRRKLPKSIPDQVYTIRTKLPKSIPDQVCKHLGHASWP